MEIVILQERREPLPRCDLFRMHMLVGLMLKQLVGGAIFQEYGYVAKTEGRGGSNLVFRNVIKIYQGVGEREN